AADYFRRARTDQDRRAQASWHWLEGLIHSARQEPRAAIAAYQQAVARKDEALFDPDFPGYLLRALADAQLRAREYDEAYRVLGQALDAYELFVDPLRQSDESARLAQAAAAAGQYANAYLLIRWAWLCRRAIYLHRAAGRTYLRHALLGAHSAPPDA